MCENFFSNTDTGLIISCNLVDVFSLTHYFFTQNEEEIKMYCVCIPQTNAMAALSA